MIKLEKIAEFIMGQAPHSSTYNSDGNGTLLVKAGDFGERFPDPKEYTTSPISFSTDKDILICVVGATSGKVNLGINASITRSIAAVRPDETKVNQEYLYYFLKDNYRQLQSLSSGSAQAIISKPRLGKFEIFVPPLENQIKIATILKKVEDLITKRKRSIQLLDDLIESSFYDLFGDPYFNKAGYESFSLDEISTKITDGEHGTVKRTESGRMYLMARNISKTGEIDLEEVSYISEEDHNKIFKRCNAEFNDLLLVCVGATIGKCTLVPEMEEFSLARSVALIKPKHNLINSHYLLHLFNTEFIKRQLSKNSNSSAQAGLYTRQIKQIKIILPTMEEQEKFALVAKKAKTIKEKMNLALNNLENLFGVLNQKAFKGKLDLSTLNVDHLLPEEYNKEIPIEQIKNQNESKQETQIDETDYPEEVLVKTKSSRLVGKGLNVSLLAEWIEEEFKGKHFTSEMLLRFLKEERVTIPYYYTSKELKENRKIDLAQDFKEIIYQAIRGENDILKLKQVFYDGIEENFVLKLREKDFDLIKDKSKKDRSGIYLMLAE